MLKNLESKLAGLVEGTFSRAFRSEVRPVEIARRLAREMEEHKTFSVSRVYAPNEYAVYLSPQDRDRMADYEEALSSELCAHLLEHARREKFDLLARPRVEFRTDERLRLGEFGIKARLVAPPEVVDLAPSPAQHDHTMVFSAERLRKPLEDAGLAKPSAAVVVVDGRRMALGRSGGILGRGRDCDIVVGDESVSRRHAEIRPSGAGWVISDLNSTNGVAVNGRQITTPHAVGDGDRIVLGTAPVIFELE
ncbi:MAG: DUF3662 and FHA domain-containing protein [Actinomycetota bacterium]